ncbi:hypothetical protein NVP1016O_01, partial [Vibrio phage 1.016.O._10N.286.46.A11]
MSRKDGQFSSDKQPTQRKARGKAERTKLLDALKRKGQSEDSFYDEMLDRAFNKEDPASPALLKEVISRLYPTSKATLPTVEFDFDENGTAAQKAAQILKAASEGIIPPDVANTFIAAISNTLKIDEMSDLRADVEEIKAILNATAGK